MKNLAVVLIVILGIFTSCEDIDRIDECGTVTSYDYEYSVFVDQFGNPADIFYYVWLNGNKHIVDFATFSEARLGDYMCVEY
jgi:hypothetical protein